MSSTTSLVSTFQYTPQAWVWSLSNQTLRSPVWRAKTYIPFLQDLDMIHSSVSSGCAGTVFAGVLALKQEAPGCFVVVGSSAAIPTEISVAWISDSRKANKRGFHIKSPELVAGTVPSHFPYTLPSGNRSYLSLSWGWLNPYLFNFICWLFAEAAVTLIITSEQIQRDT